jgi:ferritin-like metal-binding protein YciE
LNRLRDKIPRFGGGFFLRDDRSLVVFQRHGTHCVLGAWYFGPSIRVDHCKFKESIMAKKPKLLSDMFHDTLKDVYFAENRILKTLPKMAKAAHSKELKAAFVKHERETRGHVKRLQEVFKILGKPARAKTCDAIMGITKEGAEIMTDYKGMPALDAGLLAAGQAVEHYEMSRYGTLRSWAEELGMKDAAALLEATLKEEKATDAALTTLAKSVVNVEAEHQL